MMRHGPTRACLKSSSRQEVTCGKLFGSSESPAELWSHRGMPRVGRAAALTVIVLDVQLTLLTRKATFSKKIPTSARP